jgi:hypothetical protein
MRKRITLVDEKTPTSDSSKIPDFFLRPIFPKKNYAHKLFREKIIMLTKIFFFSKIPKKNFYKKFQKVFWKLENGHFENVQIMKS